MKRLFTLLAFAFLCHVASAQWINLDSIPLYYNQGRASAVAFAIGDTGYVVAGGGSCGCYDPTSYAYYPKSNTWSGTGVIPDVPGGSYDDSKVAFAIGDTGYVGLGATSGYQFSSSFNKYDPHTNTWIPMADIPGPGVSSGISFVINGKGYAGGGFYGSYIPSNAFYVYDPATGQWNTIAPCPAIGVASNPVAFTLNGKGYVGTGGYMANGSSSWPPQQDFWCYDPATNHWDSVAHFGGGPRMGGFAYVLCGKAYVGGGVSDANQQVVHNDVWEFDPSIGALGQWTRVEDYNGIGRYRASSFTIGKNVFICGGNFSYSTASLWELTHIPAFSTPNTSVCAQQSVSFTDTSNYAPTSWLWSFPGATPNTSTQQNPTVQYDSAGTYSVTLTAWNGCDSGTFTATNYMTVGAGGTLTATANPPLVCSGQTAVLSITAGSGTYNWAPATGLADSTSASISVNPSSTTTYTVTSAGGGNCPSTGQVVVTVGNTANGGTITTQRDTICSGTPGLIALSGNSKDTLHWQSSENGTDFSDVANQTATDTIQYRTVPLTASTYFRVLEANGSCSSTSNTLQLIVPPSLTASFKYTLTGQTASFNADSSKGNISSYFWDFGDGLTANIANPTHTYTADTTVSACLTIYDGSNCSYTFCRTVVWSGVKEISAAGNWSIYPNPFGNELNIDAKTLGSQVKTIELYDVLGRVMISEATGSANNSAYHLNTSALAKGMYFLQIKTATANYVQKITKQ